MNENSTDKLAQALKNMINEVAEDSNTLYRDHMKSSFASHSDYMKSSFAGLNLGIKDQLDEHHKFIMGELDQLSQDITDLG